MVIRSFLGTFNLTVSLMLLTGIHGIVASTLYSGNDDVVDLNDSNFDKLVLQSDGVALVHFGAPWSGHCKALAAKLGPAATHLKGLAVVGFFDCSEEKAAGNVCKRYNVHRFPMVKLFGSDRIRNPYTGELAKEPTTYEGPRTSKALADAVTVLLTDLHITRLAARSNLEDLARKAAGKAQVLLFTDKEAPATLYKSLSTQLRRGLAFGQVHSSASELVQEFGVEAFPTLVVVKGDGSGREVYSGELKAPALLTFLWGFSSEPDPSEAETETGEATKKAVGKGKAAAWEFVKQVDGVAEVAAADSREGMALVAVHGADDEGGCKDAREAFLTAAGEMQAVVDTLLVSVPAAELAEGAELLARLGTDVAALRSDACELQVLLLPYGKDKPSLDDYRKYEGPPDGKHLQRWVTDEVPSTFSPVQLTDMTGGAFLTMDPSEGKMSMAPKVLLFTNKDEVPGVYRALAMALQGRGNLGFAWVQAGNPTSRLTVETFKPTKIPSMTVIMPTRESGDNSQNPDQVRFGMQPYFGPLKYAPMREFLEAIALQVEMMSGIVNDPEVEKNILPQVTTQEQFKEYCTEKAAMCVVGLLDSTASNFEEDRKELLAISVQQSRIHSALLFVWLDARKHQSVTKAFGVLSSDLPSLVALSAKKMRFAAMTAGQQDGGSSRGSRLRPEAVGRFLDDVLTGKTRTEPLQALPEIREGDEGDHAAGDAPGGESASPEADAMAVEEEFDLSDILSEEVEGSGVAAGKADRLQEVEEQLKAEEEARKTASKSGSKKSKKKKSKKGGKSSKASSSEEL